MGCKTYVISCCIALIVGCGLGYFITPTKTITKTVENKEYIKTIQELQQQIKSQLKTKTRTLYRDGVIASVTTDTESNQTTNIENKTKIDDKKDNKESSKVEINPKNYILEAGYETNKHIYLHSVIPLFSVFALGCNVSTNLSDSTSLGVGLAIKF